MMFESSQFDSTPGGAAGFISTQTADPSPTSAKTRDAKTMRPVTVKQIIEATPSADDKSDFLIDGISVYNVKLVGMVFDKTSKNTNATFVVDDGTGRISCFRWIHDPHDTEEVEELTDGIYVRVLGHLKNFEGKKQVNVYAARPVKDYNEIANHFIECAHAHSCNTRLQINGSASATIASSPSATTPIKGLKAVPSGQGSQEYNMDGLSSIHQRVLDYLRLPSSLAYEKGVHRDDIAQALRISKEKITEALDSLQNEGLAYSTVDEFHYKSTAS